jgi:rhamnosyltransferase
MSQSNTTENYQNSRSPGATSKRLRTVVVLLAAYNGVDWIYEQIYSILSQNHVVTSIVINDDGSTDGTLDLLQRSFGKNGRVKLLPRSTPTRSAAQNFLFLIKNAPICEFDYVALSDQDDLWFPNKLIDAINKLEQSEADAYSSATIARWPDGSTRLISLSRPQTRSDYLFEGAGQGCTFVLTRNFFFKVREFLLKNNYYTKNLHFHDWTIYAIARSWNLKWIFDPKPSLLYRQHASNDTGARMSLQGVLKRLKLIRNGWYSNQLLLINSICHVAAPDNSYVTDFLKLLESPRTLRRTFTLFFFCVANGRRRYMDNFVLLLACIFGWI